MYEPLPQFYTKVVQNQVRQVYWYGTITADGVDYPFLTKHIVANTGKITNEICSSKAEIGTAYSSELDIDLYIDDIGVPRYKIYGAKISIGCAMRANGMQAPCPMGVFNVVEATQKGNVCSIVAYDNMMLLDVEFPASQGRCMPYKWLEMWGEACGFSLGQTEGQVRALPNGSYSLTMNWTDEQSTYRDALSQLAAATGCCAHFNRDGELELVPLKDSPSVATLKANDRYDSDIAHTNWSPRMFYVRNVTTGAITSAGYGQLAFDLGENVFLQDGGYIFNPAYEQSQIYYSVRIMLENILNASRTLSVVPISAEIPLDPCLDLFDIITLTGGQANNTKALITSITHTIGGGTEIKCAGANTTEESSSASSTGGSGKDPIVWIDGTANDEKLQVITGEQRWSDLLPHSWQSEINYTWDELLNGGAWVSLPMHESDEGFQRQFTQEFTFGVIGLTTNYRCTQDTDVRFRVKIRSHRGDAWEDVIVWDTSEHALKGVHTTTLVVPFGILDNDGALYFFNAYISGIDVASELQILTKEEVEALIGG